MAASMLFAGFRLRRSLAGNAPGNTLAARPFGNSQDSLARRKAPSEWNAGGFSQGMKKEAVLQLPLAISVYVFSIIS